MAVISINRLQEEDGAGDRLACTLLNFADFEQRLLLVVKNQLLAVTSLQPNGLGRFLADDVRVGNGFFGHFIAVHRDIGENGPAIRPGGHIVVVTIVDPLDFKVGIGNHIAGLGIPLQNGQARELLIRGRNGNGTASIDGGLIHMGDDRVCQAGVRRRGAYLHKGVHPLSHIGDGDGSVRFGGLGADDLTVLDDIKHSAGERVAAVVQLNELDFHLGVILKDQGNIGLAIPHKGLLGLADIRAERVALRRSDFLRGKAADRHILPGHIGQIAAHAGDIGASEVIVNTSNLYDRTSNPLGGIVRIHFADTALAGNDRRIGKGDRYSLIAAAWQNNILRPSIVNLVVGRRFQLSHGIGASFQIGQSIGAVLACHNLFRVGAIFRCYQESGARQSLVGISRINLSDRETIFFSDDTQFAHHNGLNIIGGVITGARAGIGVLIDFTLAPHAFSAQIQDVLDPVAEGYAVDQVINAGVVCVFQVVVDTHQFLRTGGHRVRQQTSLVPPDNGLCPGVHCPGVVAVPNGVFTQGNRPVSKDTSGMCVEVGHHRFDGGIGDGLRITPRMAFQ